jgi:drug/metabolite transporter (DMT)-like permease
MFATRGDEPLPTRPGSEPDRSGGAVVALTLTWVALAVVPIFLLGYVFVESFNLPEASPLPQAQLDRAHAAAVALAIVIVLIPAVGCVLAASTRHRVQAWAFAGIVMIAAMFGAVLYRFDERRKPPEPAPVVTQCIPRSDGGHSCPGG